MKKILITCFLSVMMLVVKAQQDAHYNQYVFNGIYVNPAYAGYKEELYVQSFFRSQWTGIKGAPKSFATSIDGAVNKNNVGLALLVSHEELGAQSNSSAYANYSYRLRLDESGSSRLSFGLGFGAIQLSVDGDKLDPADNGDNYIPYGKQSAILPDARAGIFYSTENFFAGFSANNLLARYMSSRKGQSILAPVPNPHFYLTAGNMMNLSNGMKFKTTFLLKDNQTGPTSLDVNGSLIFKEGIWLGGFYSTAVKLYDKNYIQGSLQAANHTGFMAEVFATENIRIGYAFDYSLNKLRSYNAGSHEVSIGLYFKSRKRSMLQCCF